MDGRGKPGSSGEGAEYRERGEGGEWRAEDGGCRVEGEHRGERVAAGEAEFHESQENQVRRDSYYLSVEWHI